MFITIQKVTILLDYELSSNVFDPLKKGRSFYHFTNMYNFYWVMTHHPIFKTITRKGHLLYHQKVIILLGYESSSNFFDPLKKGRSLFITKLKS